MKRNTILCCIIILFCFNGCSNDISNTECFLSSTNSKKQEDIEIQKEVTEYVMPTLSELTGYEWVDVSIVILNTIQTKRDNHKGEASATMYLWNEGEEPVLFAGYLQENGEAEYTMYTFSGEEIVENGQCSGIVLVNEEEHQIAFDGLGQWEIYEYEKERWFRVGGSPERPSEKFKKMEVVSLEEKTISAENIGDLIRG